uniref:TEPSIN adaptor related protein complex 4 accessory protein n=1 Tax=Oryzias latipes TaxID=8090 RepID=A0A3P9MPR1_ORYLA
MATFLERLAFIQKVPTLMKATADDENPCPGYLFQEIGKISHESLGCGQCLLEYLLERLQVESCHVKLKVLKIFVHLCGHGPDHFLTELRRNSTFIQQASVYSGPPDPIHGSALYQKVRSMAQEVAQLLFTDSFNTKSSMSSHTIAPPGMGMGSALSHRSTLQGFGYSPGKQGTAASESLLDKIQKAAEVVASAVLPPTEQQGLRLHDNHYRAVFAPSAPIEVAVPACAYNHPASKAKVLQWCPGQVGGGWEETDSSNGSSHNSSQDISADSRASLGSKSAGTRSQSGASRGSNGDLLERVEALQLGDCGQEVALINRLTEGSRVFLTREECQHFIKECSTLNCDVVVELLSSKLQNPSSVLQMRALCAISCLMTSDLLSLEQMFGATKRRLRQLSEGSGGPVANKATKILRQFEALIGGSLHVTKLDAANNSHLPKAASFSESFLPADSANDTNLKPHQSAGVAPAQDPPSPPVGGDRPRRCSADELTRDDGEEELHRDPNQTQQVRPAERNPDLNREEEPSPAQKAALSLFSGMEMVTKVRLCEKDVSAKPDDAEDGLRSSVNASSSSNSCCGSFDRDQAVSAFSFLNS